MRTSRCVAAWVAIAWMAACAAENGGDVPEPAQELAMDAAAVEAPAVGTVSPETVEIEGVGTCRRAGDLLFAGQPTQDGLRVLAKAGYRTVLTTRGESELDWDEAGLVRELGMTWVAIPMAYPIESIPDEWVERFEALMKEGERPMLLHCGSGNRVAGLWAVWLAEREGVSSSDALNLGTKAGMTRLRPVVEERLIGAGDE